MSTQPFLPFALPEIGEEEIQEVVNCLRSGWLTTGPKTRQFETDFEAMLNAAGGGVASGNKPVQAIAVNSATAGLHLALEAIGIGQGDEVIVPTHTFTATAEVVRYLGADPVFVDVLPGSLNIDPALVRAVITAKTKAIIPVHFAGLAAAGGSRANGARQLCGKRIAARPNPAGRNGGGDWAGHDRVAGSGMGAPAGCSPGAGCRTECRQRAARPRHGRNTLRRQRGGSRRNNSYPNQPAWRRHRHRAGCWAVGPDSVRPG